MGTSIPRTETEIKGTNRSGDIKEYKLSPEELAKLQPAKPIPSSHKKPLGFRTKNSNKETPKDGAENKQQLLREKDIPAKKSNRGRPPGSTNKDTAVVAVKVTPKPEVVSEKVKPAETKINVLPKTKPAADPAELSKHEAMILKRAVDEYGLDGVLLIAFSRQPWPDRIEDLAKLPHTTLARALYSGYAINPTPAEKVIEELSAQRTSDYKDGMLFVIKAFGLNISGLPMEEIS